MILFLIINCSIANVNNISLYRTAEDTSMECLRLTVYTFILFGYIISQIEAGLFDSPLNIYDTKQRDSASNNAMNPFLSPFRSRIENNQRPVNEKPWWKSISTQSPIVEHIFKDQTTTKRTTSDYDAIVAERFPEGVKLLENLKELNRLKEARERKNGYGEREPRERKYGNGEKEEWDRKDGYDGKEVHEYKDDKSEKEARERKDGNDKKDNVTPKPKSNGNEAKPNESKSKDNDIKKTEKPISQENGQKSRTDIETGVITKKEFYYQFQPIRPESEKDFTYERMYYVN